MEYEIWKATVFFQQTMDFYGKSKTKVWMWEHACVYGEGGLGSHNWFNRLSKTLQLKALVKFYEIPSMRYFPVTKKKKKWARIRFTVLLPSQNMALSTLTNFPIERFQIFEFNCFMSGFKIVVLL